MPRSSIPQEYGEYSTLWPSADSVFSVPQDTQFYELLAVSMDGSKLLYHTAVVAKAKCAVIL
jgi:hypothetical protein